MWFFSAPKKIIFGEEALEGLNEIEGKKALIVSDKNIQKLGIIKPIISILNQKSIKYVVFTYSHGRRHFFIREFKIPDIINFRYNCFTDRLSIAQCEIQKNCRY